MENKKKLIPLWVEGYAATGNRGTAQLIGYYKGNNLDEAVQDFINTDYDPESWGDYSPPSRLGGHGMYHALWGCRIFDNEEDARKSFG